MKYLLPALAFLMAATSFAESSVSLDIVKMTSVKKAITVKCRTVATDYAKKPSKNVLDQIVWPLKIVINSYKGSEKVVTGIDKEGLTRVTITTSSVCPDYDIPETEANDEALVENTVVKLIAKSGEAFAQPDIDIIAKDFGNYKDYEHRKDRLADLTKFMGRASERCPLSLVVGGEGAYKKHEFNCKVFSEDAGSIREMRMESGELLDAPAT